MRLLLLTIALLCLVPLSAKADSRPNFMVIMCDDLGYGDLENYGHPSIKTPHLNKLAEQGVRLTSCYSSAPVCSSSRAGLITGQTPSRIGIYDWIPANHAMHIKAGTPTIASLLRDAGYQTGQFGKWHCNGKFNSDKQPQPDDLGFDYWYATQNNASPMHKNPRNFVRNGKTVGPQEGFSCQLVADETSRWLTEVSKTDKPFFAFVCFHEPHEPIASPDDLVANYPDAQKKGEALYYANVSNMDRAVGSLMTTLDELKLADDTLIVFTSDNGPETLNRYKSAWRSHGSPGPLRGMKLHIYDGGIRVPGIVRFPGRINETGGELDVPVCALDLFPTFCELAGVPIPTEIPLDGASLAGMFDGNPIERTQPLFWHYYRAYDNAKVAVRDGDWKLVALWDSGHNIPGGAFRPGDYKSIISAKLVDFELYNITEDIAESNDVSAEHPKVTARLKKALLAKYDEVLSKAPNWDAEQ